jgi:hypothetical protein
MFAAQLIGFHPSYGDFGLRPKTDFHPSCGNFGLRPKIDFHLSFGNFDFRRMTVLMKSGCYRR